MQEIETGETVLLKLYQFTVFIRTICYENEVYLREPR